MGRARLAARDTTRKSTTLARSEARSIVLSASMTRHPFSAWAATSAHSASPRHGPIMSCSMAARPQARMRSGLRIYYLYKQKNSNFTPIGPSRPCPPPPPLPQPSPNAPSSRARLTPSPVILRPVPYSSSSGAPILRRPSPILRRPS
jgi:hypothetical protein